MTLGVMLLDVFKLGRVLESREIPIQMPKPFVQRRIAGSDVADVAFEMLHVDGVEADDGGVETDVGLAEVLAKVVGCCVLGQVGFGPVEGGKKGLDGFFVRFLRPAMMRVSLRPDLKRGVCNAVSRLTGRIRSCRHRC